MDCRRRLWAVEHRGARIRGAEPRGYRRGAAPGGRASTEDVGKAVAGAV